MKLWVAGGAYILAMILGLLGIVSLRQFRKTNAKCDLFFALAFFAVTLYLPIDRLAARNRGASILLLALQALVGIFIALATASRLTLDSGVIQETYKGVTLADRLLGRVPRAPTPIPPTTSRRTGLVMGLLFLIVGIVLHLLFGQARLFYVLLALGIGLATMVLSVLKLR